MKRWHKKSLVLTFVVLFIVVPLLSISFDFSKIKSSHSHTSLQSFFVLRINHFSYDLSRDVLTFLSLEPGPIFYNASDDTLAFTITTLELSSQTNYSSLLNDYSIFVREDYAPLFGLNVTFSPTPSLRSPTYGFNSTFYTDGIRMQFPTAYEGTRFDIILSKPNTTLLTTGSPPNDFSSYPQFTLRIFDSTGNSVLERTLQLNPSTSHPPFYALFNETDNPNISITFSPVSGVPTLTISLKNMSCTVANMTLIFSQEANSSFFIETTTNLSINASAFGIYKNAPLMLVSE